MSAKTYGPYGVTIQIEILTLAQKRRRDDWVIAKATIHSSTGAYNGHLIHDYGDHGRLSVEPARGSILHADTRTWILHAYHTVVVKDRYWREREEYGIWSVASCSDGRGANGPKHYMIRTVHSGDPSTCEYRRIEAPTLQQALAIAEDLGGKGTRGIMAADYPEAREQGIDFFEGDGLLI